MKKRNIFLSILVFASYVVNAQTLQEGLSYLDFEKYEGARNLFLNLTKAEPTKAENWYYLGQSYFNLEKFDSAAWAYQNGINNQSNNAINYIGMGELKMEDNKVAEAKELFTKALSFSKGRDGVVKDANALAMVAEAMIDTDNKLPEDALTHVKSALEIAPKNYNVLITAGDVYLELNNGGEAASNYERAEAVEPKNPKAYTRVAAIWIKVKNAEQAYTDINKALEIDPNYAPALKLMSELYFKSKKYDKAKDYYTRYLNNSEPSITNKRKFAKILFNAKDYEEALPLILDVIQLEDSDIYLHRIAGYCYYEVGDLKKDSTFFKNGIKSLEHFMSKVDPSKIVSSDYEYLAKLYSRLPGKEEIAITHLNKAIEMAPEKVELLQEAGRIYNRMKKFDMSVKYFELYIANAKKVTLVDYQALGLAAFYGKQHTKSDSAFAKILEIKPDYADGYYWRGMNNAALDPEFKNTIARDFLEKFISMAETDVVKNKKNLTTAYVTLAYFYIKNDNNPKAKEFFNKTLQIDTEHKAAKQYLNELK